MSGSARGIPLSSSVLSLGEDKTLAEDLKVQRGLTFEPIPAQLFRKCVCVCVFVLLYTCMCVLVQVHRLCSEICASKTESRCS